jgi:aspartate aminotransferase-like enzyme
VFSVVKALKRKKMKKYLLTPGPTSIPSDVLQTMSEPIIHHRTSEYKEIFTQACKELQYVFQTKNPVISFTSSGTGAMEASIVNILSPGDKIITVKGGKFGERFADIAKEYNIKVIEIEVEWGQAVKPKEIEKLLNENKDVKAVYATLCETSTGVVTDIKSIGEIVSKTNAVLIVDVISGLGAVPFEADKWQVDMAVGGSQKGLMTPPGLSFISISPKAWKMVEMAKLPRFYFDLRKAKKSWDKSDTPFTPALTLYKALLKSLQRIKKEDLENVIKRHALLARATRTAIKALGLKLLAPDNPSDAVTAAYVPENIDGKKLVKIMAEEYGVRVAGGQEALKGKIFRMAHMGYAERFDVITGIAALEMTLKKLGYEFELGTGLKAAEEILK